MYVCLGDAWSLVALERLALGCTLVVVDAVAAVLVLDGLHVREALQQCRAQQVAVELPELALEAVVHGKLLEVSGTLLGKQAHLRMRALLEEHQEPVLVVVAALDNVDDAVA